MILESIIRYIVAVSFIQLVYNDRSCEPLCMPNLGKYSFPELLNECVNDVLNKQKKRPCQRGRLNTDNTSR